MTNAKLQSNNLVVDTEKDTLFTKQFKANMPLAFTNGEVDYKMNWYIGPTDYETLKSYDRDIHKIISLGWGIFGWINMFIFIPLIRIFELLHCLRNCDYRLHDYYQNCDVANHIQVIFVTSQNESIASGDY